MRQFNGRTAVITGAGSGFGLEVSRIAAREGMRVVMADVQADALERAAADIRALGAEVLPVRLDVSNAAEVEALGAATRERFGAPHFVFNNAGIAAGGFAWEIPIEDWQWLVGVNLMGVVHGVRSFVPMMLDAAGKDPGYEGHVVNTASMAGLLSPPMSAVYNATKHAVVTLTETLHQDFALVTEQLHAHVLCPFFVPTGINQSQRNRPAAMAGAKPTKSQLVAQALNDKAVSKGKVSAAQVAQFVFDALRENRFYIYSHPQALKSVQSRLEDVMLARNPTDPFADKPELGKQLRDALRGVA